MSKKTFSHTEKPTARGGDPGDSAAKPVSLAPLAFEEALKNLAEVKPNPEKKRPAGR